MNPRELIGRAFRGSDGVIRWFRGRITRGYIGCLWLAEDTGSWHSGGTYHEKRVDFSPMTAGGEVPAPQRGETYRRVGPLGHTDDEVVR